MIDSPAMTVAQVDMRLTPEELAELRARLEAADRLAQEGQRIAILAGIVENERRAFTRRIFDRLGLPRDSTFRIDTTSGRVTAMGTSTADPEDRT